MYPSAIGFIHLLLEPSLAGAIVHSNASKFIWDDSFCTRVYLVVTAIAHGRLGTSNGHPLGSPRWAPGFRYEDRCFPDLSGCERVIEWEWVGGGKWV